MSSEEQAAAYLAEAIYNAAANSGQALWAQVVKNGYDAIEQAVSASIAAENEPIPRTHPGKINTFISLYEPRDDVEGTLLHWLQRRSSSQYVDIRGDEINIPHEQFTREDATQILEDVETVLEYIEKQIE